MPEDLKNFNQELKHHSLELNKMRYSGIFMHSGIVEDFQYIKALLEEVLIKKFTHFFEKEKKLPYKDWYLLNTF